MGALLMAAQGYPKIPRSVRLPFGWRIRIREVSARTMARHVPGALGVWSHDDDGGEILILASQPYDSKLDTLHHELAHALTDWDGWVQVTYAEPFRRERLLHVAQDVMEADE